MDVLQDVLALSHMNIQTEFACYKEGRQQARRRGEAVSFYLLEVGTRLGAALLPAGRLLAVPQIPLVPIGAFQRLVCSVCKQTGP